MLDGKWGLVPRAETCCEHSSRAHLMLQQGSGRHSHHQDGEQKTETTEGGPWLPGVPSADGQSPQEPALGSPAVNSLIRCNRTAVTMKWRK